MAHETIHLSRLILLALLVTPAVAHGQDVAVKLLFDGKPLQTMAPPQFPATTTTATSGLAARWLRPTRTFRAAKPEAAIRIIRRLVDERAPDVSAYNLALTFETMSRAYWAMKDVDGAKAAIREGLRRFPNGWQADQLRRTLARYEKGTE